MPAHATIAGKELVMENQNPTSYSIRKCTLKDLDAMMQLQEKVCASIENPNLFVPTERKENASYLIAPHFVLGVFHGGELAAYCSVVFPGEAENNYGWDLGWSAQQVLCCAKVDTIVVAPAHRGRGLQRLLLRKAIACAAEVSPELILLTTVSPQNKYSLHNVQAEGFSVLMQKQKYGGKDRFILGRAVVLPKSKETEEK